MNQRYPNPSTRLRTLSKGASVALAVTFLASCTQDQATKPSSFAAPTRPEFVSSLANEYNLIDNATATVNGAVWNQSAPFQVGTGNLNPFLRVQDSPEEEGFNTDASPGPLDADASWTKSLGLNQVPIVKKTGTAYREFILDANESNSAPNGYLSVDLFNVWLCVDAAAPNFSTRTQFEGNGNCKLVYKIDDGTHNRILATDELSSGSGNGYDYQILIPNQKFIDAAALIAGFQIGNCNYQGFEADPLPCGAYIIVDTKMGFKGGDYITGATFEEVSTVKRPWVTVTKTAVPSFKRRYNWQLSKSVNPTSITLFDGQSADATWTINVTPGVPAFTDFEASVTGSISISNTTGKALTLGSITDAIGDGYPTPTLTCPNGTTNVSLANGATYVCTYSVTPPNTNAGAHTNTATVTVLSGVQGEDPSEFTGKATFNFASASPSQEIDKNPNVYDNYNSEGEALKGTASQAPFTYVKSYPCGSSRVVSNVARVDLTAPTADLTATATLTINCLSLTVSKTASVAKRRTYQWQISKSASPNSWTLFDGDQGTTKYTVIVAPAATPFVDDNWVVSGNITIHNPNSVPVFIQSVTDVLSGAGAPSVTPNCGVSFPFTLNAGANLICSYSASLPDGISRTNTATATARPTANGTNKAFSSTAVNVDPGTATLQEVNKTVNVTDAFDGGAPAALGTVTSPSTGTFNPTHVFPCPTSKGSFTNVARITETNQTASATVSVTCRALSVTKTAATAFRRKWTWGVTKTNNSGSSLASPLLLDLNQSFIVGYTVIYTPTPSDDNMRVSGTVTVSNPASGGPAATTTATINSLADVITGPINATLSCPGVTFPTNLAAGSSINCTYSNVSLPDKTSRTNTATATRQKKSFNDLLVGSNNGTVDISGTAGVTFGATPSEALDECVNVADTNPGTNVTGKRCAGDALSARTFNYNKTLVYTVCGDYTVPNTASLTTTPGTTGTSSNTATPLTGSASSNVFVHVACPEGCTLTLGYWKTHNASFKGGAPLDDNWDKLGLKELTGFFTTWSPSYAFNGPNTESDFNWFNVFWTAPKGNAYYQLAHQYMAAKLNYLNGAGQVPAVTTAITAAENFFKAAGNTPSGWATNGATPTSKSALIGWAGTLGSYNEGTLAGSPGHCSEDNTSAK